MSPILARDVDLHPRRAPCQHADSHSIPWTFRRSPPSTIFCPTRLNASVLNHFLRLPLTLHSGIRSASIWSLSQENRLGGNHMQRLLICLGSILFVLLPPLAEMASAAEQTKDED